MGVTVGLGTILQDKYRVESVLGRGGMGIVLKVTHLHLGEELAMKVLLPEGAIKPDVTSRFLREAQAVVRLRGEHVARVTDVGVLPEGLPFIVMEYLHGVDLSGELKQRATLAPGTAADYVLQACEALAEAHAHGIVHRDIKPANLFLTTRPDGTPLVKVLDFGISKVPLGANHTLTQTEVVMGTPGYMSPEQMKATRDVDARTDIWALGIVLYECLTGRRPFDGESFSATVLIAGTEPPPPMNPRIPRGLQAVVLRCLEKDRRARFPTIAALAAALAPFANNQRDATTIAERTNLMLLRPRKASEFAGQPGDESGITTLSGSASSGLRPRRRRTIGGGLWLVCAVGALLGVGLVMFGHLRASSSEVSSGSSEPRSTEHRTAPKVVPGTPATPPADQARPESSAPVPNAGSGAARTAPAAPTSSAPSDSVAAPSGSGHAGSAAAIAHGQDGGATATTVPQGKGSGATATTVPQSQGTGATVPPGQGSGATGTTVPQAQGAGASVTPIPQGQGTGATVTPVPQGQGASADRATAAHASDASASGSGRDPTHSGATTVAGPESGTRPTDKKPSDAMTATHAGGPGSPQGARATTSGGVATGPSTAQGIRTPDKKPSEPASSQPHTPPRPPRQQSAQCSPASGSQAGMGMIVVRMKSHWAEVWIDEKEAGTTPVRYPVSAGVHKVLLVAEGHRDQLSLNVNGECVIERNW